MNLVQGHDAACPHYVSYTGCDGEVHKLCVEAAD